MVYGVDDTETVNIEHRDFMEIRRCKPEEVSRWLIALDEHGYKVSEIKRVGLYFNIFALKDYLETEEWYV